MNVKNQKIHSLCPVCRKNTASTHPLLGILPCLNCRKKRLKNELPKHQVEITTQSIKDGRREYFKSAIQPWRGNDASREFIEFYPQQAKETFTEKEIKKAKYVYKGLPGFKNRYESK